MQLDLKFNTNNLKYDYEYMAGGTLYAYRIINESAEQKAYMIVNIAEKSSAI